MKKSLCLCVLCLLSIVVLFLSCSSDETSNEESTFSKIMQTEQLLISMREYNDSLAFNSGITRSGAETHEIVEADLIGGFAAGMLTGFFPPAVAIGAIAGSAIRWIEGNQIFVNQGNMQLIEAECAYMLVLQENPQLDIDYNDVEDLDSITATIGRIHNLALSKIRYARTHGIHFNTTQIQSQISPDILTVIHSNSFTALFDTINTTISNGESLDYLLTDSIPDQIMNLYNQAISYASSPEDIDNYANDYMYMIESSGAEFSDEELSSIAAGMTISSYSYRLWSEEFDE
ncbi:MAG: hypothetical protein IKX59_08350 [Bacteroidales bacterium]|nr:hypothetical protein [Bacteroidales bacterium]